MPEHGLALEFISGLGLAPVAFVELAARLGIHRLGFAPEPIVGPVGGAPRWSLREDAALVRDLARALADNAATLALGEGFLIMPGRHAADAEADLDLFATLGAPLVNCVVLEPDAPRAAAEFATLASLAAARGLRLTVEFMPQMPCGTLAQAADLVRATPGTGILVDAMHLHGSGATAADLAALDPALIAHAQLCDARLPGFHAEYYDDARCNRPAPGEGVLPLADFVAALPAAVTIGLELPMLARATAGESLESLLTPAVATARRILAQTGIPA